MIQYKLYEVGGHVRDSIMGIKSDDIDYSVVIVNQDDYKDEHDAFSAFEESLSSNKFFKVFQVNSDCLTIRAKELSTNEVRDFVLARKETGYKDGTREPLTVGLGTLYDDLRRRDFTVNAIAKCVDTGDIIDPFNGILDIHSKTLKTPVDAFTSLNDDPLRILRAIRFSLTKDMTLSKELSEAISDFNIQRFRETVSKERVYEELKKMFYYSTINSLESLSYLKSLNSELYEFIFKEMKLKLTPTLKD